MNKKDFWKGIIITLSILILISISVFAVQKHIQVTLNFDMDEESFNESVDYVMEKYNMTPIEYLEYDIPNDWEAWYTSELKKEYNMEARRIYNSNNNTLIKVATELLKNI